MPRILPDGLGVNIDLNAWQLPAIFRWLMEEGPVQEQEMLRTFNCDIGLILVVPPKEVAAVRTTLEAAGETVFQIGEVVEGNSLVNYQGRLA